MRYFGLIVSTNRVSLVEEKVETVRNWGGEKKTKNGWLTNLFEVQKFLGIGSCHQRLIWKYSEKAEPLTKVKKKEEAFVW